MSVFNTLRPFAYIFSFEGIVDIIAILPGVAFLLHRFGFYWVKHHHSNVEYTTVLR